MTSTVVDIPQRPGRPTGARAAAREQAILDAALSLVMEVGYDRLSMDALAERAHAGKATIYRRWSGKAEVVAEAVRRRKCDDFAAPADTGSLRGDLLATFGHSVEAFTDEDASLIVGLVSAMQNDTELAGLIRRQMTEGKEEVFAVLVERAVRRGELRSAANATVANEVTSALFFNRVAMHCDAVDEAFVVHVVDDVVLPLLRC